MVTVAMKKINSAFVEIHSGGALISVEFARSAIAVSLISRDNNMVVENDVVKFQNSGEFFGRVVVEFGRLRVA